jgi:CRP/FNR family transcriptional regulator
MGIRSSQSIAAMISQHVPGRQPGTGGYRDSWLSECLNIRTSRGAGGQKARRLGGVRPSICYNAELEGKGELVARSKTKALRDSLLFSGLSEEELGELAGIVRIIALEPEEYLFWEGDSADALYIICEGRVKVLKHSSAGKEFIVAFFGPGEMFGEVAVFEGKPYPASAQAVEPTSVLSIMRGDFVRLLGERPDVALRIMLVLSGRLRDAQNRLRDIANERVEQRIGNLLLMLASKLGPELPFTRQEIADMAGTTTETAIRVMSGFKEKGILSSARGKVLILDEAKLRSASEETPH